MNLLPDKALSRAVLKISTPAVAGLSFQMIVSVAETAMVGRLENTTVVLAALGLGTLASWAITSVFSSLATGTQVLVARRHGEGHFRAAGDVLNNSLVVSLVLGLVFGVLGYFFSYQFINVFSSDPAVARAGSGYMQWRFIGLSFFLLVVSYRGFFNGIGHTNVFLVSAIIINVSNIILNYLLIFGAFGLPTMGLEGAGCAYGISNALGLVFFVGATFLRSYRKTYRYYSRLNLKQSIIASSIRISIPVSLQNIMILVGFLVFIAITGVIGTSEQAASQVVTSALFMSFLPCFGFGLGAQTLVGQSLGTGNRERARVLGAEAAKLATYFTILLGAVFILAPDLIIGIITTNREVARLARPVIQIAGAAQIVYGGGIVIAHALQAAGATVFVMLVEVLTHWVIFLPVSYLFGVVLGGGVVGAWLALPLYVVAYSFLMLWKYRNGSWMFLKV